MHLKIIYHIFLSPYFILLCNHAPIINVYWPFFVAQIDAFPDWERERAFQDNSLQLYVIWQIVFFFAKKRTNTWHRTAEQSSRNTRRIGCKVKTHRTTISQIRKREADREYENWRAAKEFVYQMYRSGARVYKSKSEISHWHQLIGRKECRQIVWQTVGCCCSVVLSILPSICINFVWLDICEWVARANMHCSRHFTKHISSSLRLSAYMIGIHSQRVRERDIFVHFVKLSNLQISSRQNKYKQ